MRLLLHVRTAFLLIPEGLCHVGITSSLGHNRVKIWFHYGYYWLNKKLVLILILYYFSMNIVALLIGLCPSGGQSVFWHCWEERTAMEYGCGESHAE